MKYRVIKNNDWQLRYCVQYLRHDGRWDPCTFTFTLWGAKRAIKNDLKDKEIVVVYEEDSNG